MILGQLVTKMPQMDFKRRYIREKIKRFLADQ